MQRITIHAEARADLDEIAEYIALDNVDAACRFYDAAWKAFRLLAGMPGMGAQRPSDKPALAGLRTWPIKGFRNYLVCYKPMPDGIEVIRVLNGARNLGRIFGLI